MKQKFAHTEGGPDRIAVGEPEVLEPTTERITRPAPPAARRSGRSVLASLLFFGAVALLAFVAVGAPLLLTKSSSQAQASAYSSASPLDLPSATIPASGEPTQVATESIGVDPSQSPTAAAARSASLPGPVGGAWWQAIPVTATQALRGGETGYVQLTIHAPTQCQYWVWYGPDLIQSYGYFGTVTDSPRRRDFITPYEFTGTAYVEVTCWRDGAEIGPSHDWRLPVVVGPALPSPTIPSFRLEPVVRDARQGGILFLYGIASVRTICDVAVTLPSGVTMSSHGMPAEIGLGMTLPVDEPVGTVQWTMSCSDGQSRVSISGAVQVLPLEVPTVAPTVAPTDAPPPPPSSGPIETPTS